MTVMMTEDTSCFVRDEEPGSTGARARELWCGLTIFYDTGSKCEEEKEVYYLDTPVGLAPLALKREEAEDVGTIYLEWQQTGKKEVFEARLKPSGKELESKYFDESEKAAYNKSGAAE